MPTCSSTTPGTGTRARANDKAYWLPVDADRNDNTNRIIADDITSDIRAIPAWHVLVVSDSCYSGALAGRTGGVHFTSEQHSIYVRKMLVGKSRTLMASGSDEPVTDGRAGHSIF